MIKFAKIVLTFITVSLLLQSCYTVKPVFKIEDSYRTITYEKDFFNNHTLKILGDVNYVRQYRSRQDESLIKLEHIWENESIVVLNRGDSIDVTTILLKQQIPTDTYYKHFSFWKTFGLSLLISTGIGGVFVIYAVSTQ
jgi:hypothetical protein